MKNKVVLALILSTLISGLFIQAGLAVGIVVPEPPICYPDPCNPFGRPISQLEIRYLQVDVSIDDQISITRIDQVFYNPNNFSVEADYLFPIPKGAAISDFSLWIDGQEVKGEILDAQEAYETYVQIVKDLKDPALLEYSGQSAVIAHIFPITPGGERRVSLVYSQVLTAENGLVKYSYPLSTGKYSTSALDEVSINLSIYSRLPIRAAYSPTHQVDVNKSDNHNYLVKYHQENVLPTSDFTLYYSIGENQALHLISFRDPTDMTDPDGFFLMLLAPSPTEPTKKISKNVILVLDRSGSMEGEKLRQAKDALLFILDQLDEQDKFNIVTFSSSIDSFRPGFNSITEISNAKSWVEKLSSKGSTDINRALLESVAMIDSIEPTYLIFITDGLPTEGETDTQKIIGNLLDSAPQNLRLFSFGVGFDVDTLLLDTVSEQHHGKSQYVLPGEKIDEIVSEFYSRLSTPLMTDLYIDFSNISVFDIYPNPLPDLFLGSQIVITGRYAQGGSSDLTVEGNVGDKLERIKYHDQLFFVDNHGDIGEASSIPRIWAARKIGYLLNQIRLHGIKQELIDQIVKLSIRYGIVTPYTSYLVTEPSPLGLVEQERIASQQFNEMEASPPPIASGQDAVEKSIGQANLANTVTASDAVSQDEDIIRYVGSRTFIFLDQKWVDTAFDPDLMTTEKIPFLSDLYFSLARKSDEISTAMGLAERVILIFEGEAFEIVDENTPVDAGLIVEDTPTNPQVNEKGEAFTPWLKSLRFDLLGILRGLPSPFDLMRLLGDLIFPG